MQSVAVRVLAEDGLPRFGLLERIESSLRVVGEAVLLNQKVDDVQYLRGPLERAIQEVFTRVLSGFEVQTVRLEPGRTALLTIQLKPRGPRVRKVELQVQVDGLHPRLQAALDRELAALQGQVEELVVGAPVEAMEWARFALAPLVEGVAAKALPGYRAAVAGEWGEEVKLRVRLTPDPPVVQRVRVLLRSSTLPGVVVHSLQPQIEEQARLLEGIPVPLLERYRRNLAAALEQYIEEKAGVGRYGLRAKVQINPAPEAALELDLDSTAFRFSLLAVLNIGQSAPDPSLEGHLGWRVGERGEAFLANRTILNHLHAEWQVGAGWEFPPTTRLDLSYDPAARLSRLEIRHRLGPRETLHISTGLGGVAVGGAADGSGSFAGRGMEVGIEVRMNEFMAVELVGDDRARFWLRVQGNL
ncbi:MAG: hypothetical protein QJR13_00080 [Bacillota bacterium]|nr:hypothetical protein [Bacillota bacterium]